LLNKIVLNNLFIIIVKIKIKTMKKVILSFIALIGISTMSFADNYSFESDAVDALFEEATEIIATQSNSMEYMEVIMPSNLGGTGQMISGDSEVVAFILCWFFGVIGVHRIYLGSSVGTYIVYCLTGGGLGCLVTIDWVLLLIDIINDGEKIGMYADNPHLFMWK
jgi:TM2 domain-containing membrane protein YozV